MTYLIIYAHCGPSCTWSKRPHRRRFVVSYVHESIHYAIQQPSPSIRLHCVHKVNSPKELSQVTSVAKQADPAPQTSGSENVDWPMQSTAYKTRVYAILLQPRSDDFISNNTAPNGNQNGSQYVFLWICEVYRVTRLVKGRKMDRGENCMMMDFITCTLRLILLGWLNQGRWGGRDMWHAWGRGEVFTGFRLGGTTVRDRWEDLGVGEKITLRWTLGR